MGTFVAAADVPVQRETAVLQRCDDRLTDNQQRKQLAGTSQKYWYYSPVVVLVLVLVLLC
jgi:hypothetical protein